MFFWKAQEKVQELLKVMKKEPQPQEILDSGDLMGCISGRLLVKALEHREERDFQLDLVEMGLVEEPKLKLEQGFLLPPLGTYELRVMEKQPMNETVHL